MNVDTITIPKETAITKVGELKSLKRSQLTEEDEKLLSLYTSISKHNARVISLRAAFRQAGLNDLNQPSVAVAQGDWKTVFFRPLGWTNSTGGEFWHRNLSWRRQNAAGVINIQSGTFQAPLATNALSTQVPYVPASVRPKYHLRNYHILFEVDAWTVEAMSIDPFLLKHINGDLYAVVAEWDLTPLEAMLVGSMRTNV
jgi:hypothetical protein